MVSDDVLSLPVMSIGYEPAGVPPVVVIFKVKKPDPVIEAGLKVALAPTGTPPVICRATVGEPVTTFSVIV